ncbi:MAG: bifunctional folylpolyglutamate synthase/dihydrofolate synthase [Candidatus Gastranaerophilales bacterium]|nr:bifunctional folylpolyglutamate synthase/dihydrofolate synthase [Candidatus Gastranaerophilales bacterium]
MDYESSVSLLTSKDKFYINLGLDRIQKILELLKNPQEKLKCIQVAGTNGKGSVCAILEAILRTAGYKTGLYTSPHIIEYTERIKIRGVNIPKEEFANYTEMITDLAGKNKIHLTEFEILTTVMFKYFADNKVDIAILETGLGGRFDATNVIIKNECAVITHIDLDHTDRLGDTKSKIAFEKSGIIKPNSAVITAEGYEVIKDKADEVGSLFVLAAPYVPDEYAQALPLKGQNQLENLALVLAVLKLKYKDLTSDTIIQGLKNVKHPCRFQYIKEKNMIIDGAHNPNGFEVLRENLDRYYPKIPKQYIFGCLSTKDYKKMINHIISDRCLKTLYFYEFNNPNACKYSVLSDVYPEGKKLKSIDDITFSDEVLTIVCGSFYMINELSLFS